MQLNGSLPEAGADAFPQLKELWLDNNDLSGT